MSSPFPGMDPFLEDPTEWPGVHGQLIIAIQNYLADLLSPHFVVRSETRVYISTFEESIRWSVVPDVYVVTRPDPASVATIAATTIRPPILIEPLYDEEIQDRYIEIYDATNREVITTLEIPSPVNKTRGSSGQQAFARKRKAVMASKTHWIEIDLLREGDRSEELADKSDYYVLLKRGKVSPFEVWFFDLRDPMPTIAVPLRPPFEDVPLDLQAVFDTAYTRAHYADSIDYTATVPPPGLRPADAAWAATRVREWLAARRGPAAGPEPVRDL